MYCRITGKSRGLPKPNYFPLLPPISPADAKRFCRITGKAYGLPSHHYIPVILTTVLSKNKCKITNVAGELGPHHFMPDIAYGKRKHIVLADYRYVFPVLNETDDQHKDLLDILNSKIISDEGKFVYKVEERKCSLVFSAQLEAAVRDGDVRDVMLAKGCDSVLFKMRQGKNVSLDLQDYEDDTEILFEGEGPRYEVLLEREKEELLQKRRRSKRLESLSHKFAVFESMEKEYEKEFEEYEELINKSLKRRKIEEARRSGRCSHISTGLILNPKKAAQQLHFTVKDVPDLVKPLIESWDWETFEKEVRQNDFISVFSHLPVPQKLKPIRETSKNIDIPLHLLKDSTSFASIPCTGPLIINYEPPDKEFIKDIQQVSQEVLESLLNIPEKARNSAEILESLPTPDELPATIRNLKKGQRANTEDIPGVKVNISTTRSVFVPGHHTETSKGEMFIPGKAVKSSDGVVFVPGVQLKISDGTSFIPGCILSSKEDAELSVFVAGQIVENNFICGQNINCGNVSKFVEGQTVLTQNGYKFVAGIIDENTNQFVAGQKLLTPEGIKFIPGQTFSVEGSMKFIPGQNTYCDEKGWEFIPGQIVKVNGVENFIPGKTVITKEGAKFIPGQYVDDTFVPGVTVETVEGSEFVPGINVETKQGPKFIQGQIVKIDNNEVFMPGKSTINKNGELEFSIAKSITDIEFNDPVTTGYVIDANTCEVSNQCLSVYGYMIQTKNGIEFYPEKIDVSQFPPGKRIPGKLIKQDTDTKFVPGIMENGGFIPGQVVWTEKGEQFIPGQVIETSEGLKFVPGQVIETKCGSKFVPGQTIDTPDGPRFVPGQIVHTKAGPTFIPGQVIYTEEEGERFVPGQVVDTEDGPRFVPGRVIESGDKVTFIPGQIVQTSEGPKFVAPDLTNNEDGEQQFSVQGFLVSPEELTLLKPTHTWNHLSENGELSIDSKMLRQLSEAGMTIGRQIEISAVDIVLQSTKNSQAVSHLAKIIGIEPKYTEGLLELFKNIEKVTSEVIRKIPKNGISIHDMMKKLDICKGQVTNGNVDKQTEFMETLVSIVLQIITSDKEISSQNGLRSSMPSLVELICQALENKVVDINTATIENILKSDKLRAQMLHSIQNKITVACSDYTKMQTFSHLISKKIHNDGELIEKISLIIEDEDMEIAFLKIVEQEPKVLYKILTYIKEKAGCVKSEESVSEILKEAIVEAINKSSEADIKALFVQERSEDSIQKILIESLSLSRALGFLEISAIISEVLQGKKSIAHIFENQDVVEVVKRAVIIRKLAKNCSTSHEALELLIKDPYEARKDATIRMLIRQSGVVTIIPEQKMQLTDSSDVPISFFCSDNQLAMEDFLLRRQKRTRGAFLIVKEGLQAVVPRESSRDVLTGKCAYTVLDENGIRYFEPLHVFSALKLSTPIMAHRFSIYSCDFAPEDADLESSTSSASSSLSLDFNLTSPLSNSTKKIDHRLQQNTEVLATRRKIRTLLRGTKRYY